MNFTRAKHVRAHFSSALKKPFEILENVILPWRLKRLVWHLFWLVMSEWIRFFEMIWSLLMLMLTKDWRGKTIGLWWMRKEWIQAASRWRNWKVPNMGASRRMVRGWLRWMSGVRWESSERWLCVVGRIGIAPTSHRLEMTRRQHCRDWVNNQNW